MLKRVNYVLLGIFTIIVMVIASELPSYAGVVILQPDGIVGKDAEISEIQADTNNGSSFNLTILWIGGASHGLIEFDVSSIPSGAVINSATLELSEDINCDLNQNALEVHANLASWNESTVTWNSAPAYGPSLDTNSGDTSSCETIFFDVTSIVQDWVSGTSNNYGLRITGPGGGNVMKNIYSSDYTTSSERPLLRVGYFVSVPTMNEWSMIIFMVLAGLGAIYYLRRKKAVS